MLLTLSPYLGLLAIQAGRRMLSRSAGASSARTHAPILYLRSFKDDTEDSLTPHEFLATLFGITLPSSLRKFPVWARVYYEAHPLRLLRSLCGTVTPTTEVQLARYFREFGPVVAIGRPGELIATEGVAREFVDTKDWQDFVRELMKRCRFVVLHAGITEVVLSTEKTDGFVWEIQTVLNGVAPEKILFCLSNFRDQQSFFEDFRLTAEAVSGWQFPRSVGNKDEVQFLFFKSDRTPVQRTLSFLSPVLWPLRGQVADLRHTLAGFVDRTPDAPATYQPRRYPGHRILAFVLFQIVFPFAACLVMYGLVVVVQRFGTITRRPIDPTARR